MTPLSKKTFLVGLVIIECFSLKQIQMSFANNEDSENVKGSYFGRAPSRFQSMEDEEGREVDFHSTEYAQSNGEDGGRSPASVKPRLEDAPEPKRMERELSRKEPENAVKDRNSQIFPSLTDGFSSDPFAGRNFQKEDSSQSETKESTKPSRSISSYKKNVDGFNGGFSIHDNGALNERNALAWAKEDSKLKTPFSENESAMKRRGVQEFSIIANDSGFYPKTFFVSRNIPVRLYVTGASKNSTCMMMDSFNIRKQLKANKVEEITFIPNQAGAYRFYCPVNNSDGMMVVKEINNP